MQRYDNQASRLRKEVLVRVARALMSDNPGEALDRLPLEMRPRHGESSRCCLYKDRQVLKYRTLAALGFGVEDEQDELMPAHAYYAQARQRERIANTDLTVIDIACSACLQNRTLVTNACRGCLGRACQTNCPKGAVTVDNGRAAIDPGTCVNCGLCLKACPYHAIVRMPVPCEDACPVKAISKDAQGREVIDHNACIACGQCSRACPFGAIQERSQLVDVFRALQSDRPVAALVAPAIVGQFPGALEQVHTALARLGFSRMEEAATGAEETVRRETVEWTERMEQGDMLMTSSCCPAYVEAARKHIPALLPHVSSTPSPMVLGADRIKTEAPGTVTVFIGPCLAKRTEALQHPAVDYVLTFEELGALMIAGGIDVQTCEPTPLARPAGARARGFAVSGGVAEAIRMQSGAASQPFKPVCINGLDRKTLARLKLAATQGIGGNFAEVMCCEGGCMSGPGVLAAPAVATRQLAGLIRREPES